MSAFPESGRSDRQKLGEIRVRFRPILLKNSVSRQQENSWEFFDCLVRESQINCVLLRCVRPDFHGTSTTPSYLEYKMTLKSQMKSPLISKRSFSTVSAESGHSNIVDDRTMPSFAYFISISTMLPGIHLSLKLSASGP